VWRRRPDAKWRVKPQNLTDRIAEQRAVLDFGAALVRPGGRLVYVTCSLLPEENQQQAAAFVERHAAYQIEPYAARWQALLGPTPPESADGRDDTLLLTPARHATDGFFIATFLRSA
jgi:16S rRNA (cytosine967-C5)-methyltransferase